MTKKEKAEIKELLVKELKEMLQVELKQFLCFIYSSNSHHIVENVGATKLDVRPPYEQKSLSIIEAFQLSRDYLRLNGEIEAELAAEEKAANSKKRPKK